MGVVLADGRGMCRTNNPLKAFRARPGHVSSRRLVPRIGAMASTDDWTKQVTRMLDRRLMTTPYMGSTKSILLMCPAMRRTCRKRSEKSKINANMTDSSIDNMLTAFSSCIEGPVRKVCHGLVSGNSALNKESVQDTRRFLHAVYRVGDLDGTLEYYKKNFGMKQIRYRDIPDVSHLL